MFAGIVVAQRVIVSAGEILFMPARWFHEVHSFAGSPEDMEREAKEQGEQGEQGEYAGVHLALNAWIEPP